MATTPSPLHVKPIPKRVSKPTPAAEAAATVAESALEPASAAGARKARPAAKKATAGKAPAGKSVAKAAAKKPAARAKAAAKTSAKLAPASAPDVSAPGKAAKVHKQKLVRDSFTIPKDEYQVLDALKTRALGLEQHVRKSELLRAGIQVLSAMSDRAFLEAIDAVPTLKTGRPKKV